MIPAAIRWPSGEPAGPGENWWDPRHHDEPTLYQWPSAVSKMTDAMLLAYHMTGNERYLEPLRSMAAIRLESLKHSGTEPPAPGSRLWCGRKLGFSVRHAGQVQAVDRTRRVRRLAGPRRPHASRSTRPIRTARGWPSRSARRPRRWRSIFPAERARFVGPIACSPVARLFGPDMLFAEAKPACNRRPDLALLYATATGDRGQFLVFPLNAVRWLTEPRDVAALVLDRGNDRFSAELFHFGERPRPMAAELYLLKPGRYTFTLVDDAQQPIVAPAPFTVEGPRTQIRFELPARKRCVLRVVAAEPTPSPTGRGPG